MTDSLIKDGHAGPGGANIGPKNADNNFASNRTVFPSGKIISAALRVPEGVADACSFP